MTLSSAQWEVLLTNLRNNDPNLTSLVLKREPIGTAGSQLLVEALKHNRRVKNLYLSSSRIGDAETEILAPILENNGALEVLHLGDNQIGDAGTEALAAGLKDNSTLNRLVLSSNQIGDAGTEALAAMLANNRALNNLALNDNQIGDAGAEALATMLNNGILNILSLSSNQIGDIGAEALAGMLQDNRSLWVLDLTENQISDRGLEALAGALTHNCILTRLGIANNPISNVGAEALVAMLRDNHALTDLSLLHKYNSSQIVDVEHVRMVDNLIKRNRYLRDCLHQAVREGDLNQVKSLLQQGVSLLSKTSEGENLGNTPLHWAVVSGRRNVTRYLIQLMQQQSIPLTTPNHVGKTAEQLAAGTALASLFASPFLPAIANLTDEDEVVTDLTPVSKFNQMFVTAQNTLPGQIKFSFSTNKYYSGETKNIPQTAVSSTAMHHPFFTPVIASPFKPVTFAGPSSSSFGAPSVKSLFAPPPAVTASNSIAQTNIPFGNSAKPPVVVAKPTLPTSATTVFSSSSSTSSSASSGTISQPFPTKSGVSQVSSLQIIPWSDIKIGNLKGHGGYGDVYKATWHGTTVAVKQLHLKTMAPDTQKAFDNETQMMAQCQFPQVIKLFGVAKDGGRNGLVMEYMPKGSLYNVLHDASDTLEWTPTRWNIALDIGRGLSYLHVKNIIHRDLTSHNILLDERYRAKIADFGLARVKSETKTSSASQKVTTGTTRWKAPELFKKSTHCKETDVYSYGMVLCEIASREMPYGDEADEDIVKDWIKSGDKPELPDTTPKGYKNVIELCYATEAAKRPTATQTVEALETEFLALPEPASAVSEVAVEKSWHFDGDKQTLKEDESKGYLLMPGGPKDCQKVADYYSHHPVPGMDIRSVEVIYNSQMNRGFFSRLAMLQKRHNNKAFEPGWAKETNAAWRREVHALSNDMAKPYQDDDFPNVKLLPVWHGTQREVLESLFSSGYANLAKTDSGFFGKGLYSAHEAEYSYRVYSKGKGALILNWVGFFSAYPTIDGDMNTLAGGANYQNYDAHFVPVVPVSNNPKETTYYPTKPKQKHTYTEVVVFDSSQCLPRYLVELQPSLPKAINSAANSQGFFNAKQAGKLSAQYFKAIDLMDAARYVYQHSLSKPYTLRISSTGEDWSQIDWAYTYKGVTVHRPNHGLRHTLSTVFYAPYVITALLEYNGNKYTEVQRKEIEAQTTAIQLALLFFVVGRENEMGPQDDLMAYKRFRKNSSEAFEKYVRLKQLPLCDPQILVVYKDAILTPDFNKSPLHLIIRVCHDIDALRCLDRDIYRMVMAAILPYLGEDNCKKLSALAEACLVSTGDRIRGSDNPRTYDPAVFLESSTNIQKCREKIEQGISTWEAKQPNLSF